MEIKKRILFCIDNDTTVTDTKDIANKFNNYCTNIGQSITPGIKYKGSKQIQLLLK